MKPNIRDAAQILLDWHDELDDPFEQALAMAQAEESASKAAEIGACEEAQNRAFVRRYLESLSRENAKLLRALTPSQKGTDQ